MQHLQKLNRDLHAENIKKTLAFVELEQKYYLHKGMINCFTLFSLYYILHAILYLLDEIAELKQENEKRRQESNLLLQNALDEISAHQKGLSLNSQACERNSTDPKGDEHDPNDIHERQMLLKASWQNR